MKITDIQTHVVHKFDNGYGASVVCHGCSYGGDQGLFELAVVRFVGENRWEITYDTPITDDVIGWLEEYEVDDLLLAIEALPNPDVVAP